MPIILLPNINTIKDKPTWDPFGTPKNLRRPSGQILIDGVTRADTVRCVECGSHFIMLDGDRKGRGYCTDCDGWLCGPSCFPCTHGMKRLRDYG